MPEYQVDGAQARDVERGYDDLVNSAQTLPLCVGAPDSWVHTTHW